MEESYMYPTSFKIISLFVKKVYIQINNNSDIYQQKEKSDKIITGFILAGIGN